MAGDLSRNTNGDSSPTLGNFKSGKQVGSLQTAARKSYRVGLTGQELKDKGMTKLRITTASGKEVVLDGVTDPTGFNDPCTQCNCNGNKIGDKLYWHGGDGECHGSGHFGVSRDGDVHLECSTSDSTDDHWGHFHR